MSVELLKEEKKSGHLDFFDSLKEITGVIDTSFYYENSFFIGIVSCNEPAGLKMKAKGSIENMQLGLEYKFSGEVVEDKQYGPSFIIKDYEAIYPRTSEAVEAYLVENCKFIGPTIASRITLAFGDDALTVLKEDPHKVVEKVKGLTLPRACLVQEMLVRNEAIEELLIELKRLFKGASVPKRTMSSILEAYEGEKGLIEEIKLNPYKLISFYGFGFLKADIVATNCGFPKDSFFRIKAGVIYALEQLAQCGDTFAYYSDLLVKAQALLMLEKDVIEHQLDRIFEEDDVVNDNDKISLASYYKKEKEIARKIKSILAYNGQRVAGKPVDTSDLAEDQRAALASVISSNVFILTGAPGTGKTYTVRKILSLFAGQTIGVAAPTGKAAARLMELTGYEASTIHRLLGPNYYQGQFFFSYDKESPLPHRVVIIDEASMINVNLFHSLVTALKDDCRLILIGDIHQLPAVGAGNVLRDLIAAGVPTVHLEKIKRQDAGLIVRNCHAIKAGRRKIEASNEEHSDFFFAPCKDPATIRKAIADLIESGRLKKKWGVDVVKDVQVLSPLKEKTSLSCAALNEVLQASLNKENRSHGEPFWIGDKVIQTKNDYKEGIINGEIGYVLRDSGKYLCVQFENPSREVVLNKKKNNLALAYALTVHKYQGSEAPVVIIPIHKCFGPMVMQRNWLYTAISRAKRACILIGDLDEVENIIDRNGQAKRLTNLERFLSE